MTPPSTTAAQTCRCVRLTGPSHASGDTHSAKTMPREPLERHQPGEQPVGALGGWHADSRRRARRRCGRTGSARSPAVDEMGSSSLASGASVEEGKERAAEDRRRREVRLALVEERDERRAAGVVAGMAPRAGDAAAEDQCAGAWS